MLRVIPEFLFAAVRYALHSGVALRGSDETQLANIVISYHVLEKGLTMENTRPGFGSMQIEQLCSCLKKACQNPALALQPQVHHATGVLKEYLDYHVGINHELPSEIRKRIEMTLSSVSSVPAKQLRSTPSEYFSMSNKSYSDFTHSRRSVRNFNKLPVSKDLLLDAIAIAQSSPSSCNRQISRVHIYQDRKSIDRLLDLQSGARGWSQLVPCLLVVTGDLRMCTRPYERDMVKVDGGMYGMNLLLALHHLKLAACPLNCYFPHNKEKKVRNAGLIPNNQSLVMMIACGHPADVFELAASPRRSAEEVSVFHEKIHDSATMHS